MKRYFDAAAQRRPDDTQTARARIGIERHGKGELRVGGRAVVDFDADGRPFELSARARAFDEKVVFEMAGVGRLGIVGDVRRTR